jgi:hypothetical protein
MLMLCPICAGEFQVLVADCPSCGCGLISSTLKEKALNAAASKKRHVEYVELCRPRFYPVAMLIKQTLEQNGVTVMLKGYHSLSLLPHLAFGGELRLLVDSDQLEYARALYSAYFEGDDETDFIAEE